MNFRFICLLFIQHFILISANVRNHDHNHNHNQNRNGMRRTSTQSYAPRNFASGGGRINPENRQRSQQEKPSFLLPPTAISLPFFSMSMGGAAPLPPPPILAFDRNSGSSRGSSSGSSSGSSAGASSLLPGVSVQIGQSNQSNQQQSDENKAKSPAEYFLRPLRKLNRVVAKAGERAITPIVATNQFTGKIIEKVVPAIDAARSTSTVSASDFRS